MLGRARMVADIVSLESQAMTLWSSGRRMLKVSVWDTGFPIDLFRGRARNCSFKKGVVGVVLPDKPESAVPSEFPVFTPSRPQLLNEKSSQ